MNVKFKTEVYRFIIQLVLKKL